MHSKRNRLWLALVSGVVLVAIIGTLIAGIPSTLQQLSPNTLPILVVLGHPTDGTTWPADTPIPVEVLVTGGTSIKSVEFWTDGRLFDTQTPPPDRNRFYKVWFWMPLSEGGHALFVRATDVNGRMAESNAVHVQASAAAGMLSVLTAQGGETMQDLADQNGISKEEVVAANPSIDPAAPIEPGTEIFIPGYPFTLPSPEEFPTSPPPSGPVVPAEEGSPSGPAFFIENILDGNAVAPNAPVLSASAEACQINLTLQDTSDNEAGFFVYVLPEKSVSFQRITSLKDHKGAGSLQYVLENQSGNVQIYVSAYNTAGESSSAPVAVNVTDPQCNPNPAPVESNPWNLRYENGFLFVPDNVQLAYLYSSINGSGWQRVPAEHDFMDPTAGPIDLRPAMSQLPGADAQAELALDVWGWSAGALVHLGQLHPHADLPTLVICNLVASVGCSGDFGSQEWKTEAIVDPDKMEPVRKLRWTATGTAITYAIWQVSSKPFPEEYSIGAPPGLLISGISPASMNEAGTGATGSFQIDFKYDLQIGSSGNAPLPTPTANIPGAQTGDYFPALGDEFYSAMTLPFPVALMDQKLYIRVMPIDGGHPAADPSNSVVVTLQPSEAPAPIKINKYPTYVLEILPETYSNEVQVVLQQGILGCSIITAVDHAAFMEWYMQAYGTMVIDFVAEQSYQYYADHIGKPLCPSLANMEEPGVLEQIGDALKGMWDGLASAFEQIKGELVNQIADLIPGCEASCRMVLMTGLNFTITYFTGLPPSFPSFEDMVDVGMEYAVQMAITQSGVPYCNPDCVKAISDEIQDVASEVAKSGKNQPGCSPLNYTLWTTDGAHLQPLCLPPGVSFTPVKGSMYEHGAIQVKVSRTDGMPGLAPMQQLYLDTFAINNGYGDGRTDYGEYFTTDAKKCKQANQIYCSGGESLFYDMVHTAPLTGVPYPKIMVSVPSIATGKSIVIPIVFEGRVYDYKPPNIYQPRADAIQMKYPGVDMSWVQWGWDFSHLTDSGSQITINAYVICTDQTVNYPVIWNSPCSDNYSVQIIVP
jgi:hypothetical protein